jgi:hypothetical protein
MKFEELTRSGKIKYWKNIEDKILECLSLCQNNIPDDLTRQVKSYLSHNELGIAIELLADSIIEYDWDISTEASDLILLVFKKMNYDKDEEQQYLSYESYLKQPIKMPNKSQ